MKKSLSMAIFIFAFVLLGFLAADLSSRISNSIINFAGTMLAVLMLILFYAYGGISESVLAWCDAPEYIANINHFFLMPATYALLAYFLDHFILIRLNEKTWVRILLIFVIFAIMSIPVFVWHPPLATF